MTAVDEVKARLDIVETVSGYVTLQKSGRYFKALCPFHTEKTPSFVVSPERQSWRCFGACATGGDAISFVMRMERLEFGGALRLLAQKTGVEFSQSDRRDEYEAIYSINQEAVRFYQEELASPRGSRAMSYLDDRGVDEKVRAGFALGLSPKGWEGLKSHLLGLGFTEDQAVNAGLLHRPETGNTRDFFRGRLMFPIHDRRGRVVGFGGRSLDDSEPKYINTPATSVFDKRGTLYALHLATEAIRSESTGVVVEGYMDAIAAHQNGYANVVASMGTALTENQVSQLKGLATNFVLALDPDVAGQEATLRSLDSAWRVIGHKTASGRRSHAGTLYQRDPVVLKIAALPDGLDPDKLIRKDPSEWERLVSEAEPLMDYLIPAVAERFDLSTGQGKAQAAEVLVPLVESADLFDQERYLRKLAQVLDVGESTLKASIGRRGSGPRRGHEPRPADLSESALARNPNPEQALEDYTLALLLSRPELREPVGEFSPDCFRTTEHRELFALWMGCSGIDDLWKAADESLHEHLTYLTHMDWPPLDGQMADAALGQCLRRLEDRHLRELQESLLAVEEADTPPPREIEGEIKGVNTRIKELSFGELRHR